MLPGVLLGFSGGQRSSEHADGHAMLPFIVMLYHLGRFTHKKIEACLRTWCRFNTTLQGILSIYLIAVAGVDLRMQGCLEGVLQKLRQWFAVWEDSIRFQ
jgi:hypothetical protein